MKLRFVLIPAAASLLVSGPAMAQATVTDVSGTAFTTAFVDPGTVECPSGNSTDLWPFGPPCTPGSRANVRGSVFQANMVAVQDSRATGLLTVVLNANTDGWTQWGPGSGPMFGKCSLAVAGGGLWTGSYTGRRSANADGVSSTVHVVMHGMGGSIDGLHLEIDLTYPPPAAMVGSFTGRILAPGGK